jgi:protein SCO1/2
MRGYATESGLAGRLATLLMAAAALLLIAPAQGCGDGSGRNEAANGFRGVMLEPGPRPDFTLTDTRGRPFDCPDVCPVQMAGIAAVLRDLPWEIRDRIEVVFVTTDPARDTPDRLRDWLSGFDPAFVGLRGGIEEVNRIQAGLDLPPSVRLSAAPADRVSYEVGHAAQVLAFAPDDRMRLAYLFGTRQADWKHDLPRLAAAKTRPGSR